MPITLTDGLLLEAFERRKRHDWPQSFEQAMKDPMCAAIVKLEAFCHARVKQAGHTHRNRADRRTPPRAKQWAPQFTKPASLDAKRMASGERDDD